MSNVDKVFWLKFNAECVRVVQHGGRTHVTAILSLIPDDRSLSRDRPLYVAVWDVTESTYKNLTVELMRV